MNQNLIKINIKRQKSLVKNKINLKYLKKKELNSFKFYKKYLSPDGKKVKLFSLIS